MSAIQEALNLREEPAAPAQPAEPATPSAPASDPFANIAAEVAAERPTRRRPTRSAPPIDEELFLQETVGRNAGQALMLHKTFVDDAPPRRGWVWGSSCSAEEFPPSTSPDSDVTKLALHDLAE